jgi:feruloyl-CoA synthase
MHTARNCCISVAPGGKGTPQPQAHIRSSVSAASRHTRHRRSFLFVGRLAENFKLASGTWVAVGPLRAQLTNDLKGLASDVVIAGEGHHELGALVVPDWSALRALVSDPDLEGTALLHHPVVRRATAKRLAAHAARASGTAGRVTRVIYLEVPLDFDRGEVTDKGSLNQRAVLRHRADLVESLWTDDPRVIALASDAVCE